MLIDGVEFQESMIGRHCFVEGKRAILTGITKNMHNVQVRFWIENKRSYAKGIEVVAPWTVKWTPGLSCPICEADSYVCDCGE